MLDRTGDDGTAIAGGALREALRRARAEAAGQTDVVVDLRHAEIARLELLRDELEPLIAQVPREIDIFDLGVAMGDRPRLFVDMVAFIEMARDKRSYQFIRDGRHARTLIAESDRTDAIVEAVTAYVARRLVERERILADDDRLAAMDGAPPAPAARAVPRPQPAEEPPPAPAGEPPDSSPSEPLPRSGAAGEPTLTDAPPVRSSSWIRARNVLGSFVLGALIGSVAIIFWMIADANRLLPF